MAKHIETRTVCGITSQNTVISNLFILSFILSGTYFLILFYGSLFAQFLSAVMLKDYETALKYCKLSKCVDLCFLVVQYLMTLSVSGLCSVNDRMINEYEAGGGMKIGRGDQSTWRKPAPESLCPLQILYDLTWATAVRSQPVTNCLSHGMA
jgi:hypothetical protein